MKKHLHARREKFTLFETAENNRRSGAPLVFTTPDRQANQDPPTEVNEPSVVDEAASQTSRPPCPLVEKKSLQRGQRPAVSSEKPM